MSEIALYNVLTKVGATPDEAEKAVAEIANVKDMATKADLERMGRIIVMWVVATNLIFFGSLVAVLTLVIK